MLGVVFLILFSVPAAAEDAPPDDNWPGLCKQNSFNPARDTGSFFKEFPETTKHYNRQDLRAHEQEEEIKNGINCLREDIWRLTNATKTSTEITNQRRKEVDMLLEKVANTLDTLTVKVTTPFIVEVPDPRDPGDLTAIGATLTAQNKILEGIKSQLPGGESRPAPPITVTSVSYATARVPTPRADADPRDQINPTRPIKEYFADSKLSIELALAAIPDPRVPRHRRQYDNAITAINQGMLRNGFVLDLYGFPWSKDLQSGPESAARESHGPEGKSSLQEESRYAVDDDHYGLMIFRRDRWRDKELQTREIEVRALYVIPETATHGLQRAALRSAILKINAQVVDSPNDVKVSAADTSKQPTKALDVNQNTGNACTGCGVKNPMTVTLFGPTFSGSVDSIRETALSLWEKDPPEWSHLNSLVMMSASATVETNERVNEVLRSTRFLRYGSLARTDTEKLNFVFRLSEEIGVSLEKVAIVYESTTFGLEACRNFVTESDLPVLCKGALQLPFPVNIADVRFGMRAKAAAHAAQPKTGLPVAFDDTRLSLEDGAENGSEFPESHQSPLTAVSTELELEHLIDTLKSRNSQIVVVIATDVRDRLFLIEQISGQLRGALFVDFGADRLLGHPDFIHATRGVLTLSSSLLASSNYSRQKCAAGCGETFQVWSTDEQAMLVDAIDTWLGAPSAKHLEPYVVSRGGLLPNEDPHEDLRRTTKWRYLVVLLGIVFSLAVALWGIFRIVSDRGKLLLRAGETVTKAGIGHFFGWLSVAIAVGYVTTSLPLAMATVIIGICVIWWSQQLNYSWAGAMIWLNTLLLLAVAFAELLAGFSWALFKYTDKDDMATEMQELLSALSNSPSGGLAYPLGQCVAVLAITVTILLSEMISKFTQKCDEAMGLAFTGVKFVPIMRAWRSAGLIVAALGVAAVTAAPVMFYFGARQVTVFGRPADFSAFIAMVATTLLSFCGLVGAIGAASRIAGICATVEDGLRSAHQIDLETFADKAVQPLMWTGLGGDRPEFLATPVMAHWWSGGVLIQNVRADLLDWARGLVGMVGEAPVQSRGLRALYALLAAEMGTYQFCIASVACAAVASSVMAYLFPVSEASALIVLNIVALLLAGVYSAYQTAAFEGNMVLSNVLSNRTQAREWSVQMFLRVIAPFIVLAIVVGIGQLPGVLDVGNGAFEALTKVLKPGG